MYNKMAEAMIPRDVRDAIINKPTCDENENNSTSSMRKKRNNSVVIAIPAEIKRRKISQGSVPSDESIRNILSELSMSLSRSDRLSAIAGACATFNHEISSIHDVEIQNYDADVILCKHLSYILMKRQQLKLFALNGESEEEKKARKNRYEESDNEIGYICSALEMVFRANASALSVSFEKIGPELLDLLLCVLMEKEDETFTDSNDLAVRKATKIMCHLARVGSVVVAMTSHPGLLKTLKEVIDLANAKISKDQDNEYSISVRGDECRLNCLWMLANLSCSPNNMSIILKYPGMIDTLIDVIKLCKCEDSNNSFFSQPRSHHARSIAAAGQAMRVFLNVTWADENKTAMSNRPELITLMIDLVEGHHIYQSENIQKEISSLILSTRCHSVGALRNIASTPSFHDKAFLCRHSSGSLLNALHTIIQSDEENLSIQERAIAVLYNLSCSKTAELIASRSGLLDSLVRANSRNKGDIPKLVEKTLKALKESSQPETEYYTDITKAYHQTVNYPSLEDC